MEWEKTRRADGRVEWVCGHGVGHPDLNQLAELPEEDRGTLSAHGCDGCCSRDDFPGKRSDMSRLLGWLDTMDTLGGPLIKIDEVRDYIRQLRREGSK